MLQKGTKFKAVLEQFADKTLTALKCQETGNFKMWNFIIYTLQQVLLR
jgi:hypothetical protein